MSDLDNKTSSALPSAPQKTAAAEPLPPRADPALATKTPGHGATVVMARVFDRANGSGKILHLFSQVVRFSPKVVPKVVRFSRGANQ